MSSFILKELINFQPISISEESLAASRHSGKRSQGVQAERVVTDGTSSFLTLCVLKGFSDFFYQLVNKKKR